VLRVELRAAQPNMVLALPVRNPRDLDQILLRRGYNLTPETITRLANLSVRSIWVLCPSLDVLDSFINEDVITSQSRVVQQITNTFEGLQTQVSMRLPYQSYRKSIKELIQSLVANPKAAVFLDDLADTHKDSLIAHCSSVTYLSLLMGLKLEGYLVRQRKWINPIVAKEVTSIGLGAMLHDIGVVDLPESIHKHFLDTGDDSDPQWRDHPLLGYRRVRGGIDPSAATIVLNHHQRFDGSGYAGEGIPVLKEERIHVFARIVGLADQFDRMHNPPGGQQQPTVAVLRKLLGKELCGRFDPHAIRALLSVVPPYPPGAIVRLSDGRSAICIDHIPANPCRPVVQIIDEAELDDPGSCLPGETIKLHEHDEDLSIAECDGHDVSAVNFEPPSIMRDEMKGLIIKRGGRVGLL
jgi:HD-GYP domain-containing protein (c-di-GMP phosphodiesterase class II)